MTTTSRLVENPVSDPVVSWVAPGTCSTMTIASVTVTSPAGTATATTTGTMVIVTRAKSAACSKTCSIFDAVSPSAPLPRQETGASGSGGTGACAELAEASALEGRHKVDRYRRVASGFIAVCDVRVPYT